MEQSESGPEGSRIVGFVQGCSLGQWEVALFLRLAHLPFENRPSATRPLLILLIPPFSSSSSSSSAPIQMLGSRNQRSVRVERRLGPGRGAQTSFKLHRPAIWMRKHARMQNGPPKRTTWSSTSPPNTSLSPLFFKLEAAFSQILSICTTAWYSGTCNRFLIRIRLLSIGEVSVPDCFLKTNFRSVAQFLQLILNFLKELEKRKMWIQLIKNSG